jgi:hypothetical protein
VHTSLIYFRYQPDDDPIGSKLSNHYCTKLCFDGLPANRLFIFQNNGIHKFKTVLFIADLQLISQQRNTGGFENKAKEE